MTPVLRTLVSRLPLGLAVAACIAILGGCGEDGGAAADRAGTSTPVPAGRPVAELAQDLAFDPDGVLVALLPSGVAQVDRNGLLVDGPRPHADYDGGALAADGMRLAVTRGTGTNGTIRLLKGPTPRARWTARQPGSTSDNTHVAWSADGTRLVLESDGPLMVFDARTGRRVRSVKGPTSYLGRQPLSPDGRMLAIGAKRGVALVDLATGKRRLIDVGSSLDRPAWSPDGRSITDGSGRIVDVERGRTRTVGERTTGALEVAWSPDSRWIARYGVYEGDADGEGGVSVVDARTGRETVIAHDGAAEERGELAWSRDSRQVAYVSP